MYQKHLAALDRIGYTKEIQPWDLAAKTDEAGRQILAVDQANIPADSTVVVTSPGPAHIKSLPLLKKHTGPILIEKPLATNASELDQWLKLEQKRKSPIVVCHNYRFKQNVLDMLSHLEHFAPGKLLHVGMHFQSPPVANDGAAWLRKERKARTLLMDYALHFIDLACIFSTGTGETRNVAYQLDSNGHTAQFSADLSFDNCEVHLFARQGFIPRKARITFTFQNYACSLGFFPDTYAAHASNDGFGIHAIESLQSLKATTQKIVDKLTARDSDLSHARIYHELETARVRGVSSVSVHSLERNYRILFALAEEIYEK